MSWLVPRPLPMTAAAGFAAFLDDLDRRLADPSTDRNQLCRELLADWLYQRPYAELLSTSPLLALHLDPTNITLEAEYYNITDPVKFGAVKPLLWLWKHFDTTPMGQSVDFGVKFRRVLAKYIFKRVGKNFKAFPFVEFSVGYNLEVGDDVVIHRNVLVDDIGGVTLHDRASLSDYVNVYSHTHSVLESNDVTLKHTTIGAGVRVTYHATVLAGSTISDDAMVATLALVNRDVNPSEIVMGIPAKPKRRKVRGHTVAKVEAQVDARQFERPTDRKGDPDYPEFRDGDSETEPIDYHLPRIDSDKALLQLTAASD
jgi:acetyltransferase-like isoleucine patch superfamily enzyme